MYCKKCGHKLNDTAKFCPHCGDKIIKSTKLETNAAEVSGLPTEKLEEQEKLRSEKAPDEEKMPFALSDDADMWEDGEATRVFVHTRPTQKDLPVQVLSPTKAQIPPPQRASQALLLTKGLRLILLFLCTILWLFAPFVAINLLSFYNQPTAFQILSGQTIYLGSIIKSTGFWAAAFSLAAIGTGFITIQNPRRSMARIMGILNELVMGIVLIENFAWMKDGLHGYLGAGFWGIFAAFLVLSFL